MKTRSAGTYIIAALAGVAGMVSFPAAAGAQEAAVKTTGQELIGEFSGWKMPVPKSNYYFIQGVVSVFGNRWGADPQTQQELEDRIWEQLVLSFEAFRRGISVEQKEIDAEITKMLTAEKVAFDRAKDPKAYEKWVGDKTREPVQLFENQLRHMMQLEKLRTQVLDSFKVGVTEAEAHQEFLNEYNTLELELVQFDEKARADEYYATMRDPASWDEAGKKDPKFCRKPGFVSVEFLMNMWKIPKDDLYKMLAMDENTVYPPAPVWKGYGVFRIVKKRVAEEEQFPKLKDSYLKQVEMIKKYEELNGWLKQLKQDAGIIVYPQKPATPDGQKSK